MNRINLLGLQGGHWLPRERNAVTCYWRYNIRKSLYGVNLLCPENGTAHGVFEKLGNLILDALKLQLRTSKVTHSHLMKFGVSEQVFH